MLYTSNFRNQYLEIPYLPGTYEPLIINLVQIHSICDGIYSNKTFNIEKEVCFKHTLKRINLISAMQNNLVEDERKFYNMTNDIVDLYKNEERMCYKSENKSKIEKSRTINVRILPYILMSQKDKP